MGRIIGSLALLPLLLSLAGCGAEHKLELSKLKNLQYARESESGHIQTQQLSSDSTFFTNLVEWLDRNRTGWRPLKATLLPGGLSVYGDGFDLRLVHQTAVLRYQDESGEQRQLYKKISNELLAFLRDN